MGKQIHKNLNFFFFLVPGGGGVGGRLLRYKIHAQLETKTLFCSLTVHFLFIRNYCNLNFKFYKFVEFLVITILGDCSLWL